MKKKRRVVKHRQQLPRVLFSAMHDDIVESRTWDGRRKVRIGNASFTSDDYIPTGSVRNALYWVLSKALYTAATAVEAVAQEDKDDAFAVLLRKRAGEYWRKTRNVL